jgi:hypothetical protein
VSPPRWKLRTAHPRYFHNPFKIFAPLLVHTRIATDNKLKRTTVLTSEKTN